TFNKINCNQVVSALSIQYVFTLLSFSEMTKQTILLSILMSVSGFLLGQNILGSDTTICVDDTLTLHANTNFGCAVTLHWYDGTTETDKIIYGPGAYWVKIIGPCVNVTDTINISSQFCPPAQCGDFMGAIFDDHG